MLNPEVIAKMGLGSILLVAAVSILIPVLLGVFLIYFPATTGRILRLPGDAPAESDIAPLQRVAFGTIGLWLALTALLDGVYVFSKLQLYRRFVEDMPSYGRAPAILPDDFATLITAAVQLCFGMWLLFGNRGLANVLHRVRK